MYFLTFKISIQFSQHLIFVPIAVSIVTISDFLNFLLHPGQIISFENSINNGISFLLFENFKFL